MPRKPRTYSSDWKHRGNRHAVLASCDRCKMPVETCNCLSELADPAQPEFGRAVGTTLESGLLVRVRRIPKWPFSIEVLLVVPASFHGGPHRGLQDALRKAAPVVGSWHLAAANARGFDSDVDLPGYVFRSIYAHNQGATAKGRRNIVNKVFSDLLVELVSEFREVSIADLGTDGAPMGPAGARYKFLYDGLRYFKRDRTAVDAQDIIATAFRRHLAGEPAFPPGEPITLSQIQQRERDKRGWRIAVPGSDDCDDDPCG